MRCMQICAMFLFAENAEERSRKPLKLHRNQRLRRVQERMQKRKESFRKLRRRPRSMKANKEPGAKT